MTAVSTAATAAATSRTTSSAAAATTATAVETSSTAFAWSTFTCDINNNLTTFNGLAVEHLNSSFSLLFRFHLYKSEASLSARCRIENDAR
jgi:hypothetical protein